MLDDVTEPLPLPWQAPIAWGHRAPYLLVAAILATVGLRVAPAPMAAVVPLTCLVLAVVMVGWLTLRQHDRRLCEACLRAMPLDPAAAASRSRWRLATVHAAGNPRLLAPYLAVVIGSNFWPGAVGVIVWTAAQLSLAYLVLAHVRHRLLQPWCPWCQGGDGGHQDQVGDNGPLPDRRHQPV